MAKTIDSIVYSDDMNEVLGVESKNMKTARIADGRSNNDISEQIHVSLSTVKKHVYNIFNKVGVNSRTQLLNLVFEMGR